MIWSPIKEGKIGFLVGEPKPNQTWIPKPEWFRISKSGLNFALKCRVVLIFLLSRFGPLPTFSSSSSLHLLLLMCFGPPALPTSRRILLPIFYKNSTTFLGSINPSLVDKIMNKFQYLEIRTITQIYSFKHKINQNKLDIHIK